MERLLTIKEAAEFLNVSEMSLRRWTNSGKLKCYRVGGKRERRFFVNDLMAFMEDSGNGGHRRDPVPIEELRFPGGAHLTHFYTKNEEAMELSVPFVCRGLQNHEAILMVLPPEKRDGFMMEIGRRTSAVASKIQAGRLMLSDGRESPVDMIRFLSDFMKKNRKFRVVGDMLWAVEKKWDLSAFRRLEQAPDLGPPFSNNGILLCQYSLNVFSGAHIMMAAESHDHIIYRGEMEKSRYYRPPEKLQTPTASITRH